MNKYIALGLGVLLVIVGLVYWFFVKPAKNQPVNLAPQTQTKEKKEIIKKDIATNITPDRFPANIPIEKDAKITQNYNATAPDGRFQATRVFITTLSLSKNLSIYKDFLVKDGWKIETSMDMENYKMVLGSKGPALLQVSIDNNSAVSIKTVSISYTESPAKK